MAYSFLAIGPFGIFLGSVARLWSVAARPVTQAQHHSCCQDVWVGKGNAAGRYKHSSEGPGEDGAFNTSEEPGPCGDSYLESTSKALMPWGLRVDINVALLPHSPCPNPLV